MIDGSNALEESWRWFPHTFAQRASNGKWKPYPHLVHLSKRVYPGIVQGGGRYIITMPPRHGKSEFISHWLPTWFLDLFPHGRIGLASYAATFAKKWGKKVKHEFDTNPYVINSLSPTTKAGDKFEILVNNKKLDNGMMMTAGVDGPFTGEGFDLIIVDDPYKNFKEANSETTRQNVRDWWTSVAETRLEPGASVIILHTRWHEEDLIGWLLGMEHSEDVDPALIEEWELINLPAIAEEEDEIGRKPGEALCPPRYTVTDLAKKEINVGPKVWDALYQQNPTAASGDVWKKEWWKYWDKLPTSFDEMIQSWDLRFGDKKNAGSWVVGQVWGRKGRDYYLLDQVRDRWSFTESVTAFRDLSSKWPMVYKKLVENKANGAALSDSLKNEIMGIDLVDPMGGKFARAIACQGALSSGRVYIPPASRYPWVKGFIKEASAFSENGSHKEDDQVDSASQAMIFFEGVQNSALLKLINQ